MFTQRKPRTLATGLALTLSATVLAACGGGDADETTASGPEGDLEQAAIDEGQLTIYASAGESQIQALADGFMEAYPDISVDYFRAAGTALFNRFETEADAGTTAADVFMPTVQPSFVNDHPEWFAELTDDDVPEAADWPADFRTDYTIEVAVEEVIAIYNTDKVDTPPESWEDVLDDSYRGRVVLVDPKASPGYMSWYAIMRETYGDEFLEALAGLDPSWVDTGAVGAQQVAAGSADVTFPTYPSHGVALIDQGAPLDFVKNLDPTQGITTSVAITADAPNPNAARLFANWLVGPDGFKAICADPVYSATIDGTDCQELASTFVQPKWDVPAAEQDEIVALLGR